MTPQLVISCEHASAVVPRDYEAAFREPDARAALRSHRGSDLGAQDLARRLAHVLDAPLVEARATRLLVDANRSLEHPHVFSEWSARLDDTTRARAVEEHWQPHRAAVETLIAHIVAAGQLAVHVSVHSFTPVWDGAPRKVDVGLLYDPARVLEREFVASWEAAFAARERELALRHNEPYLGTDDGLTTSLRRRFDAASYAGIELEVSQRLLDAGPTTWNRLGEALTDSLRAALRGDLTLQRGRSRPT